MVEKHNENRKNECRISQSFQVLQSEKNSEKLKAIYKWN